MPCLPNLYSHNVNHSKNILRTYTRVIYFLEVLIVEIINIRIQHLQIKQDNRRHQTSPLVLPPGESLSICPIGIAFAWLIMGKHNVIHKTRSA